SPPMPFFSMEFADGGSLAQKLSGSPLPFRRAAQLLEMLARAMHHAHQQGVIHRDLKPANVLLRWEGEAPAEPGTEGSAGASPSLDRCTPKITDFGLAKIFVGELGATIPGYQTQTGAILGTPSYMPPE